MKKTLLSLVIAFTTVVAVNAQTVWNLGGDPTVATNGSPAFAVSAGIGNGTGTDGNPAFPVTINGLAITGISSNVNMGQVEASAKTFTDANSVAYAFANRFKFNGAGYAGAAAGDATPLVNMPTQRYLSFNVSGNSTIYVIGITGSSSSDRKLFVTDGTNYVGAVAFPAANALNDGTITYTGGAATLYVYCNAACNLTYLSVTNTVLPNSLKAVLSDKGVSFNGTEILNNKGLSIEVYSVLGKRIANSTSSISTTNFQKGVYVVRVVGTNDALKIKI